MVAYTKQVRCSCGPSIAVEVATVLEMAGYSRLEAAWMSFVETSGRAGSSSACSDMTTTPGSLVPPVCVMVAPGHNHSLLYNVETLNGFLYDLRSVLVTNTACGNCLVSLITDGTVQTIDQEATVFRTDIEQFMANLESFMGPKEWEVLFLFTRRSYVPKLEAESNKELDTDADDSDSDGINSIDGGNECFEVEEVLEHRYTSNGTLEYLLKWAGKGDEQSWEEDVAQCSALVRQYNHRQNNIEYGTFPFSSDTAVNHFMDEFCKVLESIPESHVRTPISEFFPSRWPARQLTRFHSTEDTPLGQVNIESVQFAIKALYQDDGDHFDKMKCAVSDLIVLLTCFQKASVNKSFCYERRYEKCLEDRVMNICVGGCPAVLIAVKKNAVDPLRDAPYWLCQFFKHGDCHARTPSPKKDTTDLVPQAYVTAISTLQSHATRSREKVIGVTHYLSPTKPSSIKPHVWGCKPQYDSRMFLTPRGSRPNLVSYMRIFFGNKLLCPSYLKKHFCDRKLFFTPTESKQVPELAGATTSSGVKGNAPKKTKTRMICGGEGKATKETKRQVKWLTDNQFTYTTVRRSFISEGTDKDSAIQNDPELKKHLGHFCQHARKTQYEWYNVSKMHKYLERFQSTYSDRVRSGNFTPKPTRQDKRAVHLHALTLTRTCTCTSTHLHFNKRIYTSTHLHFHALALTRTCTHAHLHLHALAVCV
jgi:hypothetical protein